MTTVLQAKLGPSWALLSPGSALAGQRRSAAPRLHKGSSDLSDDGGDPDA
jgi:hypothetical protein